MSTQKLLIIVLVALVVIFVITVGIGGCHGGGDTDDAGAVRALKGLQGNRFLEIGDKASASPPSCGEPRAETLTVNGTCVITFEKRAFLRRSTRVVFRTDRSIRVIIDPTDGPRQDEQIGPPDCFASAINYSGGTITLSLIGSATITLLREGCPE